MTLLKFIWTFKGSTVGQTNLKKKKTKKKHKAGGLIPPDVRSLDGTTVKGSRTLSPERACGQLTHSVS